MLLPQSRSRDFEGVGIGRHSRDALIEIEKWQLKWSCHAQKNRQLTSRMCRWATKQRADGVMAQPCGSVTNGVMHIVKVVDAGTCSQKNVEKSLTGRAQRDDRRASADCSARQRH
jgi:hypothetical protein